MERTITGTVEKVYDPTASNRPWNIVIDGKRCAAWAPKGSSGDRCPLAEVAKSYVGSNVEAKVDESQNGEYTNYKLLSIKLADFGATEHSTTTSPVTTAPETGDARHKSIVRQCCIKAAAAYAGAVGLEETNSILGIAEKFYLWCEDRPAVAPESLVAAATETNDGTTEW